MKLSELEALQAELAEMEKLRRNKKKMLYKWKKN